MCGLLLHHRLSRERRGHTEDTMSEMTLLPMLAIVFLSGLFLQNVFTHP